MDEAASAEARTPSTGREFSRAAAFQAAAFQAAAFQAASFQAASSRAIKVLRPRRRPKDNRTFKAGGRNRGALFWRILVRYWLIGCGALLVIVIVLGVVGYNYVKDFAKEYGNEIGFVVKEYRDLDRDFPFTPPPDGVIGKEDFAAFIACRRDLLKSIDEHFADFEKDETSWKDRISMVVNMIPKIGTAHVKALRKAGLSPAAYRWMVNLTLTALRYAERGDAPPKLKALRKDLESLFEKENPLKPKKSGPVVAEASDRKKLKDILPGMDPLFISLPPGDIALIAANADGLHDTGKVFFFDASFLETKIRGLEESPTETSKETSKKQKER